MKRKQHSPPSVDVPTLPSRMGLTLQHASNPRPSLPEGRPSRQSRHWGPQQSSCSMLRPPWVSALPPPHFLSPPSPCELLCRERLCPSLSSPIILHCSAGSWPSHFDILMLSPLCDGTGKVLKATTGVSWQWYFFVEFFSQSSQ